MNVLFNRFIDRPDQKSERRALEDTSGFIDSGAAEAEKWGTGAKRSLEAIVW